MVTRIGIVGIGWVARDYMVPALATHPNATLVAVVSPNPEDFRGLDEAVRTHPTLEEMVAEGGLDAVYVATPNHLHREHAVACLEAGLDVLCEKPLAILPEDAAAIAEAAERSGRTLATAFDQRWHPAHRTLRRWVRAGKLGTLTQVRIDYACWLPPDWAPDNWRVDYERAGGGAVIDLAPHGLDLTEFLTGQRITYLHCLLQNAVHDYSVDDGGVLSARLDGGVLLTHSVGYNRPDALPRRRLEVIGTAGRLLAENTMGQTPGGTLTFTDAGEGKSESIGFPTESSPFYDQLDGFLASLQTGGKSTSGRSPQDDVRLCALLHAALRAAHNQPIPPPLTTT